MKTRIRPFTGFLVKQNSGYIIMACVLVVLTAGLIIYMDLQVEQTRAQIDAFKNQNAELTSRRNAITSVKGESVDDLDYDLQLLTTLIPDSEDYFSIISSLERLSRSTGFRIDSYAINFLASTSSKLSITVVGTGDSESFLQFLKDYPLRGGRLITAERIGIDPQNLGSIALTLNFYNKKASTDTATGSAITTSSLAELEAIKQKVSVSFTGTGNPQDSIKFYPTKTDPF